MNFFSSNFSSACLSVHTAVTVPRFFKRDYLVQLFLSFFLTCQEQRQRLCYSKKVGKNYIIVDEVDLIFLKFAFFFIFLPQSIIFFKPEQRNWRKKGYLRRSSRSNFLWNESQGSREKTNRVIFCNCDHFPSLNSFFFSRLFLFSPAFMFVYKKEIF